MHGQVFRPAGNARKAGVILAVLAAHLVLLTTLVPPVPPRGGSHASAPMSVVLLPAPPPRLAPQRPQGSEPRRRPPASTRGMQQPAPMRPGPAQPPPRPGEVLPARSFGLPSGGPGIAPLDARPSVAEQARARAGRPALESGLQRDVMRAARPGCKDAYAGLGLFAIPALVVDSMRDDGCKW